MEEQKPKPEHERLSIFRDARHAWGWLVALVVAMALAGYAGSCEGGQVEVIAYASAAATVFAAFFAILIYSWTRRANTAAAKKADEQYRDLAKKYEELLQEVIKLRARNVPASQLQGESGDEAADETLPARQQPEEVEGTIGPLDIRINGVLLRHIPLEDVPIKVLGDLYAGWVARGHTGRWNLGRLVDVRRKPGRGNNPYLLLFDSGDGDGSDNFQLWKVSYGGQSKTDPTVDLLG